MSACVSTVDNDDALGMIAADVVGSMVEMAEDFGGGWSWDNLSAKERSVDGGFMPFICVVGGSVPVKTRAFDSS